jgi:hypothetical protein
VLGSVVCYKDSFTLYSLNIIPHCSHGLFFEICLSEGVFADVGSCWAAFFCRGVGILRALCSSYRCQCMLPVACKHCIIKYILLCLLSVCITFLIILTSVRVTCRFPNGVELVMLL